MLTVRPLKEGVHGCYYAALYFCGAISSFTHVPTSACHPYTFCAEPQGSRHVLSFLRPKEFDFFLSPKAGSSCGLHAPGRRRETTRRAALYIIIVPRGLALTYMLQSLGIISSSRPRIRAFLLPPIDVGFGWQASVSHA